MKSLLSIVIILIFATCDAEPMAPKQYAPQAPPPTELPKTVEGYAQNPVKATDDGNVKPFAKHKLAPRPSDDDESSPPPDPKPKVDPKNRKEQPECDGHTRFVMSQFLAFFFDAAVDSLGAEIPDEFKKSVKGLGHLVVSKLTDTVCRLFPKPTQSLTRYLPEWNLSKLHEKFEALMGESLVDFASDIQDIYDKQAANETASLWTKVYNVFAEVVTKVKGSKLPQLFTAFL